MKILMVFPGLIDDLPPMITAAFCMKNEGAEVTLLSVGCSPSTRNEIEAKDIRLVSLDYTEYPKNPCRKVLLNFQFFFLLRKYFKGEERQVVWYHGAHAMKYDFFVNPLQRKHSIVSHCHELYDRHGVLRYFQNRAVRKSTLFITPNIERAWIMKCWTKTDTSYCVVPNHPAADLVPSADQPESETVGLAHTEFRAHGGDAACTRLLICQGLLSPDRCILELIRAFQMVRGRETGLILMGGGTDKYYLQEIYTTIKTDKRIVHLPRIPPPKHLEITRGCFGGIMLYAPTSLNNIFCAPNKLFEYSHFGLGIVMPEYPSLRNIKEEYGLGETCNPTEPYSIANAIEKLLRKDREHHEKCAKALLADLATPSEIYKNIFNKVNKFQDVTR